MCSAASCKNIDLINCKNWSAESILILSHIEFRQISMFLGSLGETEFLIYLGIFLLYYFGLSYENNMLKKNWLLSSNLIFFNIYNFATGPCYQLRAVEMSGSDISQSFASLIFWSIFLTKCSLYQNGFRSILRFELNARVPSNVF